jgi:hypothetical protein
MPDPLLRLEPTRLVVQPGGQARAVITITNVGPIVEGFRIEVLGDGPAGWADVSTPEVSVYPRQEGSAVVTLTVPAGAAAPSGVVPFAVRAVSLVDESMSAVAEGDLEIGRVGGLQSKITPVNSSGRWSARHRVELTNWGNAPVRLRLAASDPDDRLGFLLSPDVVDIPLGGTASARLKVRTRTPALRAQPVRLPFQVRGEPDPGVPPGGRPPAGVPSALPDPLRPVLDGAFTQRPILTRATVVAGVLAVVAVVAIGVVALTRGTKEAALGKGAPGVPVLVGAAAAGDSAVRLTWRLADRIDSYKLLILDGVGNRIGAQTVDGSLNVAQAVGLKPATRYCFQLQAFRGKQSSSLSAPRCTSTAKAGTPGGGSASSGGGGGAGGGGAGAGGGGGGGGPGQGQWIGVVQLHPVDDPSSANAGSEVKALKAQGLPAGFLDSAEYPGLGYRNESIVVFVGPFDSVAAARAACAKAKPRCLQPPAQPGPRVSPSAGPSAQPTAGPAQ